MMKDGNDDDNDVMVGGSNGVVISDTFNASRAKEMNVMMMKEDNEDDGVMVGGSKDGVVIRRVVDRFDGIDAAKVMASMNTTMNDDRNIDNGNFDSSDDEINTNFVEYSLDVDRDDVNSVVMNLSKSVNIIHTNKTKIVDGCSDGIIFNKTNKKRAKPSDKMKETNR